MKVIKRDGRKVGFDKDKIVKAIESAMKYGSGIYNPEIASRISEEIEDIAATIKTITIFQIEDIVFDSLIKYGEIDTAKAYEGYRAIQEHKREDNTTDESIIGLLDFSNEEVMNENSNKDANIISTQRDLIAGEVSKDIADRKILPPHLVQAHKDGKIHIHDKDYLMQPMFNCCLPNVEDMLWNGTVINGKMIERPRSFQVACNVMTQIVAQVASNQYGGQSISPVDTILAPYVRISYEKYYNKHCSRLKEEDMYNDSDIQEMAQDYAWEDTRQEVKSGVQTIQYQINTLN